MDNTGAAIQALAAAGHRGAISDAVGYLRDAQNPDGGFGQFEGRSSNAQSTAYAVQGLVAAGRNPGRFRRSGKSPLGYLRSLQRANGSVDYSRASEQTPVWVTAQAVMALERKPLPLDAVSRQRARGAEAASDSAGQVAGGTTGGASAAAPEPSPSKARERSRSEREGRVEPVDPARASAAGIGYAPFDEEGEPAVSTRERGSGPSWLGVALTLSAAALAYYAGRRIRPTNVATKRSATAA